MNGGCPTVIVVLLVFALTVSVNVFQYMGALRGTGLSSIRAAMELGLSMDVATQTAADGAESAVESQGGDVGDVDGPGMEPAALDGPELTPEERGVSAAPGAPAAALAASSPAEQTPPVQAASAPAAASTGQQAAQPSAPTATSYDAKYGFYIHAFSELAAIKYQVERIKEFYPGSPIYIMSDGGEDFTELCKLKGCTFTLCPPANDRWHPWPFIRRFYDAAVSLNAEFIIMLEPDNTLHGPITREPQYDAGGIFSKGRGFRYKQYIEDMAHEVKPNFTWTKDMMQAGLAGGSYFRRAAILDAFRDDHVARLDWNMLGESSKNIFSSDFAMPYLLASRGYEFHPWDDVAQYERDPNIPYNGAADAAFRHYSRGFPGGKPTYQLRLNKTEKLLSKPVPPEYISVRRSTNCQLCYSLKEYINRWGSDRCTNRHPFEYSQALLKLRNRRRNETK